MKKNRNCKMVYARKKYKCDCCGKQIVIGEHYLRLNIKNKGIFHFCKDCKNDEGFITAKINNPDDIVDYEDYEEEELFNAICYDSSVTDF